jgi:antitoxin VapB
MSARIARIFTNGGSQAVRLPAEFRFNGDEVFIRRDERTGDVILSPKRAWNTWNEFFTMRDALGPAPSEFMADRPLNAKNRRRKLFDEER